jgi:hypothetical protein
MLMPRLLCALCMLAVAAVPLIADQPTINGKPDFSGKWRLESSQESSASTSIIEQAPDTISIRELTAEGKAESELRCSVKAKDCSGKVNGRDANLVFYFNGPMLVQFTRMGSKVTKVRRTLSEDGKKMTVEVMPMEPYGKPEKLTLVRADATDQKTSTATR